MLKVLSGAVYVAFVAVAGVVEVGAVGVLDEPQPANNKINTTAKKGSTRLRVACII